MAALFGLLICICIVAFIVSVIWLILSLFKRKSVKKPLCILIASPILLIFFTIIGVAFDVGENEANSAIEQTEKVLEAETTSEIEESMETTMEEEKDPETSSTIEATTETVEEESTAESETSMTESVEMIAESESPEDKFLSDLEAVLDSSVAEKAYDILKNQIGFSELEYEGQPSAGLTNYEIYADSRLIMMTASDDVYRIFIPNGKTVFYEKGEVKITASEFSDKLIDQYDATSYYIIAKEIVKNNLKSPKGASFPGQNEILFQKKGNLVAVKGYVDAKNSFNAKVRGEWIVEFEVIDLQSFSYNTVFINIDGTKAGEFIPLD